MYVIGKRRTCATQSESATRSAPWSFFPSISIDFSEFECSVEQPFCEDG